MPCYYPLDAWRTDDGEITFKERGRIHSQLSIPCGRCIGCRLERSRMWAGRCLNEAKVHDHNCFLTLTYDDEHLPEDRSLNHRHFQLFMKRLRQACSRARKLPRALHGPAAHLLCNEENGRIGYYMAGEYGEDTKRPHYHALIFGMNFSDKKRYKGTEEEPIYESEALAQLWEHGHATIAEVNFKTAAYCARYIMDKVTGPEAEGYYQWLNEETGEIHKLEPEYNAMSTRPPIGRKWLETYYTDVYPDGQLLVNGALSKAPKYYDRWYKEKHPEAWEVTEFKRQEEAKRHFQDGTRERLAVREKVTRAQLSQFKRNKI